MLVALDPSMHCTGIAIFNDCTLVEHYNVEVPSRITGSDAIIEMVSRVYDSMPAGHWIETIVAEVQTYRGSRERMQKQQLLDLHAVCFSMVCKLHGFKGCECVTYTPSEWNGGVPKRVIHQRIRDKYDIDKKSGPEDYLDAIAIGDFYLRKQGWIA